MSQCDVSQVQCGTGAGVGPGARAGPGAGAGAGLAAAAHLEEQGGCTGAHAEALHELHGGGQEHKVCGLVDGGGVAAVALQEVGDGGGGGDVYRLHGAARDHEGEVHGVHCSVGRRKKSPGISVRPRY